MIRNIATFILLATSTLFAEPSGVAQFQFFMPANVLSLFRPSPWPDEAVTSLMRRIERQAPKIAVEVYPPVVVERMRFFCVRIPKTQSFNIVLEAPEDIRASIAMRTEILREELFGYYASLAFSYHPGANIESELVDPLDLTFFDSFNFSASLSKPLPKAADVLRALQNDREVRTVRYERYAPSDEENAPIGRPSLLNHSTLDKFLVTGFWYDFQLDLSTENGRTSIVLFRQYSREDFPIINRPNVNYLIDTMKRVYSRLRLKVAGLPPMDTLVFHEENQLRIKTPTPINAPRP